MWSFRRKSLIGCNLLDNNSTLLGDRSPALQAFQPAQQVGVGSPASAAGIRVQKRFGLAHGLAFRFQVHFGIDAGCRDAGVTQPATDHDQVHTGLQEIGRTLARRKVQGRLTAAESDRVVRLARIAATAVDVLGNRELASARLQRPNRALGHATPLSQMDTDVGVRQVERVLGRIEHGVFS